MITDEELAAGVQRGDRECLGELVRRHHGPLLGFLYRALNGDRPLAEDLVQEAFLRVLRGIAQYQAPRPFKPWLYGIALHLARDHHRRLSTRLAAGPDESERAWERLPAPGDPPESSFLAAAEAQRVARAVQALPDHQREAVLLRYYQDLSLAEIAAVVEAPVGTVKSRLSLGLKKLREVLGDGE